MHVFSMGKSSLNGGFLFGKLETNEMSLLSIGNLMKSGPPGHQLAWNSLEVSCSRSISPPLSSEMDLLLPSCPKTAGASTKLSLPQRSKICAVHVTATEQGSLTDRIRTCFHSFAGSSVATACRSSAQHPAKHDVYDGWSPSMMRQKLCKTWAI